jgi:hypothetical protein
MNNNDIIKSYRTSCHKNSNHKILFVKEVDGTYVFGGEIFTIASWNAQDAMRHPFVKSEILQII